MEGEEEETIQAPFSSPREHNRTEHKAAKHGHSFCVEVPLPLFFSSNKEEGKKEGRRGEDK